MLILNSTTENPDNVIGSIHETRRQIHERFAGNMEAMFADAKARTEASGRTVLHRGDLVHETILPVIATPAVEHASSTAQIE